MEKLNTLYVNGCKFQVCHSEAYSAYEVSDLGLWTLWQRARLAPVLKTIFHQCVISYTCSQSNSDGSV